jgi:preprotein translocase subunit YajC
MPPEVDARAVLAGQQILTITGRANTVLRVEDNAVVVATGRQQAITSWSRAAGPVTEAPHCGCRIAVPRRAA